MTAFQLKIVTPDGLQYEGPAEQLSVRTTTGDVGILAGHINFVAPLGMGEAMVLVEGQKRRAACIGGMVSVVNGLVTLLPTTFEWAEEIDVSRAEASEARAQEVLQSKDASDGELVLAKARLKRALVRKSVANRK
jgi:F-type H+-transporting ATPase subunit epsilon